LTRKLEVKKRLNTVVAEGGHYLLVVQLAQELLLVHHRVDAPLRDDAGLSHLFHREELLLLAQLDFPDLAEAATADYILEVEVVLVDLCTNITN
jgi:hypothetical protein